MRILYVSLNACFSGYISFTFSAAIENADNACKLKSIKQFQRLTTTGVLTTVRCHFNPRYKIISSQNSEYYGQFLNRNITA